MKWRSVKIASLVISIVFLLFGCSSGESAGSSNNNGDQVELTFMYWGSNMEKQAIQKMIDSFNKSHPDIKVVGQHVAGDYNTKVNTLMASNELPDVAYLGTSLAKKWAQEGKIMDLTDYQDQYPALKERVAQSYLYYEPGKNVGNTTASEIEMMFYNKSLFEEAGVEVPPSKAEDAWTWDELIKTAQKLTKDSKGRTADESDFNPKEIMQYGISIPSTFNGWLPMVLSNGGDIINEEGTELTLNTPEAKEVFQNIHDLIYKYHIAPTPVQMENMPATSVSLQTKKVAMAIDGQWALLDIAGSGVDFGVAVLPKFDELKTIFLSGASVIFSSTEHPEEALEFYMYHNDPEQVDLFETGLWMPIQEEYYTDEAKIKEWTDNPAHPEEYRDAAINYLLDYAVQAPEIDIINWDQINTELEQGLDQYWTDAKSLDDVLAELEESVSPLLEGRYPSE
ncbi:sugar ABC transporter substrate-binding protein [Niallia sp. JL1B1071]|uniref:ABC transporter substrate-binding protein n=1 Tax=Niallia tiangongensis TaxID=3237105 RepID=UPI0037DD9FE5